tara:strand:+ start:9863 stop:10639 length:777 start_codon:yes stop_codon:yes gene_type:complete
MNSRKKQLDLINQLLDIMDELRLKCPWDKKQTFQTLRTLTIEEVHELSEAIMEKNNSKIMSELGDIFLHIIFYSKIASDDNIFDIGDVTHLLCEKLINRHPHIYGDIKVSNVNDVKNNWELIKLNEGNKSIFSGIPESLPEIIKALRIQDKASGVGFEWKNSNDVWKKFKEEENEFLEAIHLKDKSLIENEFGDLMFSLINYARFIKIDPDMALRKSNKKFVDRFKYMEKEIKLKNKSINSMNLEDMNFYWREAKKNI